MFFVLQSMKTFQLAKNLLFANFLCRDENIRTGQNLIPFFEHIWSNSRILRPKPIVHRDKITSNMLKKAHICKDDINAGTQNLVIRG